MSPSRRRLRHRVLFTADAGPATATPSTAAVALLLLSESVKILPHFSPGHPLMMSTKFSDFLNPLTPCPHLELIYDMKFTQLRPLFHDPLPPPMRTSYLRCLKVCFFNIYEAQEDTYSTPLIASYLLATRINGHPLVLSVWFSSRRHLEASEVCQQSYVIEVADFKYDFIHTLPGPLGGFGCRNKIFAIKAFWVVYYFTVLVARKSWRPLNSCCVLTCWKIFGRALLQMSKKLLGFTNRYHGNLAPCKMWRCYVTDCFFKTICSNGKRSWKESATLFLVSSVVTAF